MIEVTQADRDAAERWGTGPVYNMQHLAEAFARHRIAAEQRGMIAARDAAVKFLKEQSDSFYAAAKAQGKKVGPLASAYNQAARAIATMPMPAGGSDA